MLPGGLRGTGDIPITGIISIETTPIGAIIDMAIVMTSGSMKNTIMARERGGIKDSVTAARRHPAPGDINPVQVMWVPRRDLNQVQVTWVPRQDLKRGLVMRVLRRDLKQVQVMWAPRQDLKRGLVMWVLPLERRRVLAGRNKGVIIKTAKPSLVLTNLKKSNPGRKNISPDYSWDTGRGGPGEEIPG